ncbi:MAG: hypothetical protein LBM75_01515 [Myxococcales bacterium]|jgi:ABC-2 type transport system permease protein|nr:hypothetical protein [Myxococcales bacterium]
MPHPRPFALHRQLALVWKLRLTIAANRFRGKRGSLLAILGALALFGTSGALGFGIYALFSAPQLAAAPIWTHFLLRLFAFLISAIFIVWPILSAGVDEQSELTRFTLFPIRPFRLFLSSTIASLVEPRALFFWPLILGLVLGYGAHRPFCLPAALAITAAYFAFNIVWGSAALTAVLNVLRHRRSAELIGLFFIAAMFGAALLPPMPINLDWIYALFNADGGPGNASALIDTQALALRIGHALARLPPTLLATGLEALAQNPPTTAAQSLEQTLYAATVMALPLHLLTLVGLALSYRLLLSFYRGTAQPAPREKRLRHRKSLLPGSALRLFAERELSDLLRNPKARLLLAVPFFLCILFKLVSARDLGAALLADGADAWLLYVLCAYASVVVTTNFSQNSFAYDGAGLALLFAAPAPPRLLLLAKNLVHALVALSAGIGLTLFYALYASLPQSLSLWIGLLAIAGQLPVLLLVGNVLSAVAPRKFHASLRRRDRPPMLSTFVGFAAAALALTPSVLVLRAMGRDGPSGATLLWLGLIALLGLALYALLFPHTARLLETRRERVLQLVLRE